MLEQILGLLLGIAIGFIMVYKNKGRASATAGGATGGTGTSGTGGPTGGTATGDAETAERQRREEERQKQDRQRQQEEARRQREERQRQEEERLRQEEERRRRAGATGGTTGAGTTVFSAKFKEKPHTEHAYNVDQWGNIKKQYQSGGINFPGLFTELNLTNWINGFEPDVRLVHEVLHFVISEFTTHPEFFTNERQFKSIKNRIILVFHPDRAGRLNQEHKTALDKNQLIENLYGEITKAFVMFFDSVEDSRKKRYPINYSISIGKLKQDIDKCFK